MPHEPSTPRASPQSGPAVGLPSRREAATQADPPCHAAREDALCHQIKTIKAFVESFPPCEACGATGKTQHWLDINPDSPPQMADLLYRGYRIRARRYKGEITTRADQLAPLGAQYPVVEKFVNISALDANRQTLERLTPDTDGRLHCVFDP